MNRCKQWQSTSRAAFTIALLLGLQACGGGGGGSSSPQASSVLSGTAATGKARANVSVRIKGANNVTADVTTDSNGKYSRSVSGLTAPYLLRVPNEAGNGFIYSVATATGTANVHPFTDLIIRNWYKVKGSDVETEFGGTLIAANLPTVDGINTIKAVINEILATSLGTAGVPPSFDLITSPFDANQTAFDKVLDDTIVTIAPAGNVTVEAVDPTTGASSTLITTSISTDLPAAAAVPDTTLPSNPANVVAIAAGTTSIGLTWTASTDNVGVVGYNIYRDNGTTKIATSPYPAFLDTGRTSSTQYCYQVQAVDADGNLSAKIPVSATSICATTLAAPDTTAPPVPTNLSATAVSSSQINLSWAASGGDTIAYSILRGGVVVASAPGTTYSDTGLAAGSLYSYTVKSKDAAGNTSAASTQASATTQAGIPSAPTGVQAVAGNGQAVLSWNAVSGATSYTLYVASVPGVSKATGGGVADVTSPIPVTGLTNGTTYYFVVTAVNGSGESVESAQVSATPAVPASNALPAAFNNIVVAENDALGGYFLRFGTNGEYLHGQTEQNKPLNTGVEYGASGSVTTTVSDSFGYRWAAVTTVDTNGDFGLSHPLICDRLNVVNGNLIHSEDLTTPGTCATRATGVLAPTPNVTDGIVGAWALGSATTIKTQHFIFLPDGRVMMVDPIGDTTVGPGHPCGGPGVESGSYTFDTVTKVLTVGATPAFDTNGCAGLWDSTQGGNAPFSGTFTLTGTGATATVVSGGDTFTMYRVSAAKPPLTALSSNIWQTNDSFGTILMRLTANGEVLFGQVEGIGQPNVKVGVEYGAAGTLSVMSTDALGAKLSVSTLAVDTLAQAGLSHLGPCERIEVSVDGSQTLITEGSGSSTDGGISCIGSTQVTGDIKADNNPSGIVGVWALDSATVLKTQHIAFFADGKIMMVDPIGDTTVGPGHPCGGPGVELGTYTYVAATGALDVGNTPIADTNGCAGLWSSVSGNSFSGTFTLSGTGTTATVVDGPDSFTVYRVSK
jgi:chitodextrinase